MEASDDARLKDNLDWISREHGLLNHEIRGQLQGPPGKKSINQTTPAAVILTAVVCVRAGGKSFRTRFRTQVDIGSCDMMREPAYFDSQAQAAAALNIDIYRLRDAKREGCPAFRSGRVYREELLDWFAKKRQRRELTASNDEKIRKRQQLIADTFIKLMECANANLLNDDQFFDVGKTIVETAKDELMLEGFIGIMFRFVDDNFPELSDAYKAHPQIVDWLCAQAGVKYGGPGGQYNG